MRTCTHIREAKADKQWAGKDVTRNQMHHFKGLGREGEEAALGTKAVPREVKVLFSYSLFRLDHLKIMAHTTCKSNLIYSS